MFNYFEPYKDYFWHWDADYINDETIYIASINGGQSITYFNEILEILEDLSNQGLPPFGSLLLVLIAINKDIQDSSFSQVANILSQKSGNDTTIENAFKALELIRQLPHQYKTDQNKTLLIQTLFENCHNKLGIKKSNQLIKLTKNGKSYYLGSQKKSSLNNSVLSKDIRPIALLIRRFKSTEDIINAINKVPKSELLDDVEIEEGLTPQIEKEKSFLEELTDNKSTFQIGSLVKRIWSGLNIPMHNNLPSSQPLGGVSDITNKGDFSRLLISEYAHDDDIFMSRIANNEALFIERETPPETNNKERIFLIDASLKNWGIPKILSFASAIAIATHPKSNFLYSAYVIGDSFEKADLSTVLDVIESQHILSGALHCANGLEAFLNENNEDDSRELFFLTEESNLNNSNLQNVIYSNYNLINYIITTNAIGDIDFYKHQNKSRKHFQHILLPYQDIWDAQSSKYKTVSKIKNSDLQIEHILLEPINKSNCIIVPYEDEIYIIQNSNLYALTSKGLEKGLQLIHADIPYHNFAKYTIAKNTNNERYLFYFLKHEKEIARINLKTKAYQTHKLNTDILQNETILLFTWKDNIILTNKKTYWSVPNDNKLYTLDSGNAYQKALLEHQEKIHNFKQQLKRGRVNYNILKNIKTIDIEYNNVEDFYLDFYDFVLEDTRIIPLNKSKYYYTYNSHEFSIDITAKASLYLKKAGVNKLVIIRFLKDRLNIPLKRSKRLVDSVPRIIATDCNYELAEDYKDELEELGATCYTKINYFEANDGSTIHIENGQLIFTSSNHDIPQFYITSVLNYQIAMATYSEFAGNTYFLPVKNKLTTISPEDFKEKYINPFVKHIIDYED